MLSQLLINKFKIFIIFFALFFSLNAQVDEIIFNHYTSEDGLSLNSVTEIIQDKRGFLWFGTYNGLNRFDGYNFKVFMPENGNPKSLSNHLIQGLFEDSKGYIWVGTQNGLNRYDWRTEEFKVYRNDPKNPGSLSHNYITSFYEDKNGNLWIGTLDGLNKYDREKDNFSVFHKISDYLNPYNNTITTIAEDDNGILWLGTWNGISCINKRGELIKQYFSKPPDSKDFDFRIIEKIYKDSENYIWIGTNGKGLKKYNPGDDTFTDYINHPEKNNTISNDYITAIFEDKEHNLWIATRDGLNLYDSEKDSFIRFYNNPLKFSSLLSDEVLSINQDRSGLIWVGTSGGASSFFISKNKFNYIKKNKNNSEGLSSNNITSLYIDEKENLWIGTFDGLDLIKKNSDKVIHFKHQPENINSIRSNYIISVKGDKSGNIWIGTQSKGISKYNPVTGIFKHYQYDPLDLESISNNGILSTCEDKNGNLWFGTWWGFNGFNKKEEKFKRYLSNQADPKTLRNNLIWIVYEDSDGMLWLGTDGGGASCFNPATETFTHFTQDSLNKNYLSGTRVFDIIETSNGKIWFATQNGLNCYDKKSDKVKVFSTEDGLPSILCSNLIEDNEGYLWIGTDKGLSKMDIKKETFINFSKWHGLKDIEISSNVSAKSKDGTLYFGTKNGIVYFHPDSIDQQIHSSPVVFTDLKIFNESVKISKDGFLKESITTAKKIEIPSGFDVITIEFALLEFYDVKRNSFRYKLEGFDKSWNNVGSRNSATYTNLPPGEFIFHLRATGSNSRLNEQETSLKLVVVPNYYQTWWFKITVALFLIVITLVIIQIRIRAIQKYNRMLEGKVSERTKDLDRTINELSMEIMERKKAEHRAQLSLNEKEILLTEKVTLLREKEILLKEIHHRVKNNLQIISSLLYLNSKKIKDAEALNMFKDSQNRIKSIALVHERLYQSSDLAKINFNEYVQKLTTDLFRSYGVDHSRIKLEIDINNIHVNVDQAVPCGLIINELVSNALKYAFPDTNGISPLIRITFKRNGSGCLELNVSDNGVGMPQELEKKKKNSLGLQLVDNLVTQLDGVLELNTNPGTHYKINLKF